MLHLISSPQSLPLLLTLSLSQLTLTWGKVKPFQDSQLAHPFVVVLVAQSCLTLCNPMDLQPTRLLCLWDSLGKNTGVGSHSLLQGIFLTQRLNLGLPPIWIQNSPEDRQMRDTHRTTYSSISYKVHSCLPLLYLILSPERAVMLTFCLKTHQEGFILLRSLMTTENKAYTLLAEK